MLHCHWLQQPACLGIYMCGILHAVFFFVDAAYVPSDLFLHMCMCRGSTWAVVIFLLCVVLAAPQLSASNQAPCRVVLTTTLMWCEQHACAWLLRPTIKGGQHVVWPSPFLAFPSSTSGDASSAITGAYAACLCQFYLPHGYLFCCLVSVCGSLGRF